MDVKTYRANSMQAALNLIRSELGPEAAVLHARRVPRGIFQWITGSRRFEVVASAGVRVPSRLEGLRNGESADSTGDSICAEPDGLPSADRHNYRAKYREEAKDQFSDLQSLVEEMCERQKGTVRRELPESLFHLFTDLIDAEVSEELARELIDRVRGGAASGELDDPMLLKARITRIVEDEIQVTGPLRVTPDARRLIALVGPTGVGKTTTIAKLAANYRLREKRRVGLITVDTYRIAAVDQLRTYADIIDLPMEVVSTPREMRAAVARMSNMELILMDTAGRSPRDEVQIQELKSMLAEAQADEVHLVLSSVSSAIGLTKTAEQFADIGTTALVLTKLDESTGLGNLLPLLRNCHLPLSYLTNGQNVPDDIEPADKRRLARMVLGMEAGKKARGM